MKHSKIKTYKVNKAIPDWDKIAENRLKTIEARKVHETAKYLISIENLKNPLNYIIYPKRADGSLMLNEYGLYYASYELGKDWAIELAEDTFKNLTPPPIKA